MKNASINIPSALGGAALLGLVLLVTSSAQAVHHSSQVVRIKGPVQVIGMPAARDTVNIREGTPFTVPPGKILVITFWTRTEPTANAQVPGHLSLRINGAVLYGGPVGFRIVVPENSIVEVQDSAGAWVGVAGGYLEDA